MKSKKKTNLQEAEETFGLLLMGQEIGLSVDETSLYELGVEYHYVGGWQLEGKVLCIRAISNLFRGLSRLLVYCVIVCWVAPVLGSHEMQNTYAPCPGAVYTRLQSMDLLFFLLCACISL
jgi:hypothetical protein